jgi:hypothetical protein
MIGFLDPSGQEVGDQDPLCLFLSHGPAAPALPGWLPRPTFALLRREQLVRNLRYGGAPGCRRLIGESMVHRRAQVLGRGRSIFRSAAATRSSILASRRIC